MSKSNIGWMAQKGIMSKNEAKKIVEKYADKLKEAKIPFSDIYLDLLPKTKLASGAILMLPSFPRGKKRTILLLN
ncbi:MAG: hypothetical protein A3H68_00455 [Candidatus Taylorbacteria bacterium RIFCSPLOWO2_02_FULL_46_40]|uniref:Uncharacterized protein n=1 Tax=Candidatus Taylorbacteria bacterium RIFCSPLOWO2_02_FULL_46_40 TaxID=1802329 RepID=A0A1G2P254_9BACT|nr:MAG: hypothetical protein A3H68_00455 [Candidatus Taylorbacteria bacterium RIFCSPLOWO2_02_FULL_46_40]